jgi:hypothetical protein
MNRTDSTIGPEKKDKRRNNVLQKILLGKLNIEQQEPNVLCKAS